MRLAARDARRAAQRAAALQPVAVSHDEPKSVAAGHDEPKNWISVFIGAGGTAAYLTLAAWSYSAGTGGDMIGAGILLVLAYLVAVAALMASKRYGGFANRRRLIFNLIFAIGLAVISGVLFWWEYSHRPAPIVRQPQQPHPVNNQQQGGQMGGTINNNGPVYNGPVTTSPSQARVEVKNRYDCPPGYTIIAENAFSGFKTSLSAPASMKLCIVENDFNGSDKGIEFRDRPKR